MAVQEQTPYVEYVANGVTTSFALEFDCDNQDHLIVLVDDVEPVVGAWSFSNGAVVFNTAPEDGKKITIQRNTPFSRTTDYQSYNNSFRPPAVNKDFDWIWLKLQELGVADWILGARIEALKNYVDDRDDELRAYLMEEIRKQGVALDQLDDYYNYLMQRLAQIAVDKGWDASFVVDASGKNQQQINDKFSKFKQPEIGSVERDLSVRARDTQHVEDYASIQDAFNAKRFSTTVLDIGFGTKTLTAPLSLTANHQIKGKGEMSLISCPAGTGIVYSAGSGLFDDHTHRSLKDFRILGDGTVQDFLTAKNGTTTGYQFVNTGHMSETYGMTFDRHGTGMKIESSYTNRNSYNYYRANKIGLHLKSVTSHREESIYARYNSEAAILIEGQIQNITFAGGAVEGNRGRGLWVKNLSAGLYAHIILDDVYFEGCGDRAAGIPAIDVQYEDKFHIDVRGGSYWNNITQGITSGIYKWGNSVSFVSSTLNGYHYAKKMRVKDTIDYAGFNTEALLATAQANGLTEPVMMLEYQPTFRVDGFGPVFQVPLAGRPTRKMLVANEAILTYPHVLSKSVSTTTTENTSLNYGDGSWTDIAFSASGDYNNNYAQLTNLLDATSEYMSKVFVFLLKPTADCQIGIIATGGTATNQAYFQLKAGVTYRMCCFANRSASGDYRMRLFSVNGAATISYLPIYLAKFRTTQEGINFANMFATGSL